MSGTGKYCTSCGEIIINNAKFCSKCGTQIAVNFSARTDLETPSTEQLTGVTSGVRSYINNASEDEKNSKKGQQSWGLFETNYQRNKGITTHQSLDEIEQFSNEGVTYLVKDGPGGRGGSTTVIGGRGGRGGGMQGGFSGSSDTNITPGYTTTTTTYQSGGGTTVVGSTNFDPSRSNSGDSFFRQHQDKEAQKYKPGYRGNTLN